MKIRTQLKITLVLFTVVFVALASFMVINAQRVSYSRSQESIANGLAQAADELSYLSGDFVIYREEQQLNRWQLKFSSFSNEISRLRVDDPEELSLVNDINMHSGRLKEVFDSIRSTDVDPALNQTEVLEWFEVSWTRLTIQTQSLASTTSSLASILHDEVNQLNLQSYSLIISVIVAFCVFVVAVYVQTFRRTLKSIAKLQAGASVVGSGDLDFRVNEDHDDEIGELSRSFDSMTANLKNVTASKAELEREIGERKKVESDLQWRNEELEGLRSKLEAQATNLEQYANNMEALAAERAEKLQDSERLAAIGATAAMVGHDIRNPLQAIISELYLARDELSLIDREDVKHNLADSLKNIENEIDYVNKIVQDLQDFARPIAPFEEKIDVESLLEGLLFNGGFPEEIEASLCVREGAKVLATDVALLKRVMTNLVNNAVQAMPAGGKLNVCVFREGADTVLTVEDTGCGISEEVRSKLFTPLFTTKSKGQGFGLAVVKRMTEALGGQISFETEVGKGTKFIVRLPQKDLE